MTTVFIQGIGLKGPGLNGWSESQQILANPCLFSIENVTQKPHGNILPPTERRRSTLVTRLAVDVAEESVSGQKHNNLATVFASSGGEVEVIHKLFVELSSPEPRLSPTQFHNSVHNTAAGYWSIATGSLESSSSLCAFDDSFSVGLFEASILATEENRPVLLVVYDYPPAPPIFAVRPLIGPFAISFLIYPAKTPTSLAKIRLTRILGKEDSSLEHEGLERLRTRNPAARSLPIIQNLARKKDGDIFFSDSRRSCLHIFLECLN